MNRFSRQNSASVRTSVLICFTLMALALVIPAAQCAYHLGGRDPGNEARQVPEGSPVTEERDKNDPLAREPGMEAIRNQILMGLLAVLICMGAVCLFFLKHLVAPLHRMADAAQMMAGGRLDVSAPLCPRNEIGQAGAAVNDLAVNLQEVLLHVWHHTNYAMARIGRIEAALSATGGPSRRIETDVADIRSNLQEVRSLVRTFDCYDIALEEGRIEAARPGRTHRPSAGPEARPPRWDLENSN
jgi:HAMP domain-containing protein